MDKKPKKPKRIRTSKSVLNKNHYHYYKNGKQFGTLKFEKKKDGLGLRFDWDKEEEKEEDE